MPRRTALIAAGSCTLGVAVLGAGLLGVAGGSATAATTGKLTVTPTRVAPGGVLTVTGTGCAANGQPVAAAAGFDVASTTFGVENGATPNAAGTWRLTLKLSAKTPTGSFKVNASCARYDGSGFDYTPVTVTVSAAAATTSPTPTASRSTAAGATTGSAAGTTVTGTTSGSTTASTTGSTLPSTGGPTTDLVVLGCSFVVAGGCVASYGRRSSPTGRRRFAR